MQHLHFPDRGPGTRTFLLFCFPDIFALIVCPVSVKVTLQCESQFFFLLIEIYVSEELFMKVIGKKLCGLTCNFNIRMKLAFGLIAIGKHLWNLKVGNSFKHDLKPDLGICVVEVFLLCVSSLCFGNYGKISNSHLDNDLQPSFPGDFVALV